ncbi:Non-imprinted in Prader-Willi/Angelman syndrome region protein 2-like protein [Camponotus floridanus]|uniref:Non-imprinted in Prader-Willi/Angelman syndrome region protein 2-like protein n=1 Tax=Camponotus floridanus TaxID=104421 RepID=E2AQJ9_CAMFO|nr:Non-imprinted in Prader-Willi/Angelman syndrome region protein 2-like protein [Camponotus floridanus]
MIVTTEVSNDDMHYDTMSFYIGLGLAISSSGFIGASFIIKKIALIRLQRYGGTRASSGGFGYLKEWIWWAGLLSMGIGEVANFIAYAFAPASLVTPLGALSVLVSAVLASKYLNEKLNLLGKMGCLLCVLGSTIIVLHSPKEEEVSSLSDLIIKIKQPAYGKQNVSVYICLCSSVGSLTVMSCKGLGLALRETISGKENAFVIWLTWVFIFSIILCIIVQMNYLNKSLDLFDTSIVTPIYYVLFTTLVIIASAILFREWEKMSVENILGACCGFLIVIIAIFLLNAFKEIDISYGNIKHILKPKREILMNYHSKWEDQERVTSRLESQHLLSHNYANSDLTRTV